jgi:4-hydroxybenzoate polyprenyltransferase
MSTLTTTEPAISRIASLPDMISICRPKQWVKNVFVLAPLFFSELYGDVDRIVSGLIAFACFCLVSSSVYLLNDVVDIESDRCHPRKRNGCDRPSGR